jgi:hypothetical protein
MTYRTNHLKLPILSFLRCPEPVPDSIRDGMKKRNEPKLFIESVQSVKSVVSIYAKQTQNTKRTQNLWPSMPSMAKKCKTNPNILIFIRLSGIPEKTNPKRSQSTGSTCRPGLRAGIQFIKTNPKSLNSHLLSMVVLQNKPNICVICEILCPRYCGFMYFCKTTPLPWIISLDSRHRMW